MVRTPASEGGPRSWITWAFCVVLCETAKTCLRSCAAARKAANGTCAAETGGRPLHVSWKGRSGRAFADGLAGRSV